MIPQDYLNLGISVFPVRYRDKRPLVKWSKYRDRLPTEREFNLWSEQRINWGVVCGAKGLTVLDFDNMDAYNLWLWWALRVNAEAANIAKYTYKVMTRRGVHLYVFCNEVPRCAHIGLIDIKAQGGYVLIPPSIHPSGSAYVALNEYAPILTVDSINDLLPKGSHIAKYKEPEPFQETRDIWDQIDNVKDGGVVETILARIRIMSMLSATEATGDGWYRTTCPFHEDHNPSFWIDDKRNKCGCHVCLDHPLDVIEFYGKLHNLDNGEAIQALRKFI